jgi:hypothetical protein
MRDGVVVLRLSFDLDVETVCTAGEEGAGRLLAAASSAVGCSRNACNSCLPSALVEGDAEEELACRRPLPTRVELARVACVAGACDCVSLNNSESFGLGKYRPMISSSEWFVSSPSYSSILNCRGSESLSSSASRILGEEEGTAPTGAGDAEATGTDAGAGDAEASVTDAGTGGFIESTSMCHSGTVCFTGTGIGATGTRAGASVCVAALDVETNGVGSGSVDMPIETTRGGDVCTARSTMTLCIGMCDEVGSAPTSEAVEAGSTAISVASGPVGAC